MPLIRRLLVPLLLLVLAAGPAAAAAITSLSATQFKDTQAGLQINGSGFGASQGSGFVRLYAQGRNQLDPSTGQAQDWIEANQTVTAWGDTQVIVTVVLPSYRGDKWPAWYRLELVNGSGQPAAYASLVLVGPNQSTSAAQNAAGFVPIATTDDPQTLNNAEAAGTAYFIETGLHPQWSVTPQAGDIFVADAGAILEGGEDISDDQGAGWSVAGASWSRNDQSQPESTTTDRVDTTAESGAWAANNTFGADFYIGTVGQPGPMARIQKNSSKAAIEAAGPTTNTLASDPITTVEGSHLVVVRDTSAGVTGTVLTGSTIYLSGAAAVGGQDVNGWHNPVDWDDTSGTGEYRIWLPTAATASATGGGASVSRTKGVQVFFDDAANTVYINFNVTDEATHRLYAAIETGCFDGSGNGGGLNIRGKSTAEPLEFRHYKDSQSFSAIAGGSADAGGWRLQYLWGHHNAYRALTWTSGSDVELWDSVFDWNGEMGMGPSAMESSFARRLTIRFNNISHFNTSFGAGTKWTTTDTIDFDQASIYLNFGIGLWFDIDNLGTTSDGIRRLDLWENRMQGLYYENNSTLTAALLGKNNLIRDNYWFEDQTSQLHQSNARIKSTTGTASFHAIIDSSQIEVTPTKAGTLSIVHCMVIRPNTNQQPMAYGFYTNNTCLYTDTSAGVAKSGFYVFSATDPEISAAQSTSDFGQNEYYTKEASTAALFAYLTSGPTINYVTAANWQAGTGGVPKAYDDDSVIHFSQSDAEIVLQRANWRRGAMPTWGVARGLASHSRKVQNVLLN